MRSAALAVVGRATIEVVDDHERMLGSGGFAPTRPSTPRCIRSPRSADSGSEHSRDLLALIVSLEAVYNKHGWEPPPTSIPGVKPIEP
jgi:hypothetical protein